MSALPIIVTEDPRQLCLAIPIDTTGCRQVHIRVETLITGPFDPPAKTVEYFAICDGLALPLSEAEFNRSTSEALGGPVGAS